MTKDLLKTLEAMRPDTRADRLWPQHLQAAVRARIMDTTSTPEFSVQTGKSKRVAVVALTAAAAVTVGGVGVVAATGLMPTAFTDQYSHWKNPGPGAGPEATPVDPATAERIGSIPGPDGTVYSVFIARGAGDQRCLAPIFETAADTTQPGPSTFTDLGSRCWQGLDSPSTLGDVGREFGAGAGAMVGAFGSGGGEILPSAIVFDAAAGAAMRAELRLSTGQTLPTVLADGVFFGWFPRPEPGSPRPVLTGYAPDGTVVGSIEIGPNF